MLFKTVAIKWLVKYDTGGIFVCVITSGLGLVPMITGSAVGFGLMGAGPTSLVRSQQDTCTWEDYRKSTTVGFVAGAVTGGALEAATVLIVGAGVALSAATIGQQAVIGAIAGSVGGACQSLASDVERYLLDDEDIGAGKMLKNAMCTAAIGTAVGVAGGAMSSHIDLMESTDADEVIFTAFLRKLGVKALQGVSQSVLGSVLNCLFNVFEERLNSETENRRVKEHLVDGLEGITIDIVLEGVKAGTVAAAESFMTRPNFSRCISAPLEFLCMDDQKPETHRDSWIPKCLEQVKDIQSLDLSESESEM